MPKLAPIIAAAVATVVLGPCATAAQISTTFVSSNGDDLNPCTRAAPCRSFAAAVLLTSPGGQVTMVDPGGYGAVTITRAISIVNDGVGEAGIADMSAGQDAITIQAGPSDVINLRGLTLNGLGTGRHGVNFVSGGTLNIQNCVIRAFPGGDGVFFNPTGSAAITIADTIVSDNAANIFVEALSGAVAASLQRVVAIGGGSGIAFVTANTGVLRGTIADSVAARSSIGAGQGVFASGAGVTATLVNSRVIQNNIGVETRTSATLYMSQTTVAGNVSDGFEVGAGSVLHTFGDNYIIDTNNVGTLTAIGEQ